MGIDEKNDLNLRTFSETPENLKQKTLFEKNNRKIDYKFIYSNECTDY